MQTVQIFSGLLKSQEYFNKTLHHLKTEYFDDHEVIILNKIKEYSAKYKKKPRFQDIKLLLEQDKNINSKLLENSLKFLDKCYKIEPADEELLFDETETFCKDRAFENVLRKAVDIIQGGETKTLTKGMLPELFREALSLSFKTSLGHDYFRDAVERYKYYISDEEIIESDLQTLNELLKGGFRRKSLYVFLGRTSIGKTLVLCHLASCLAAKGLNVLYISGEMAEEKISHRIDANLLNIEMDSFNKKLDKKLFLGKIKELYQKGMGKIKVKEYSPGACSALTLESLLSEYKLKDNFVPDVLILDYINLFSSFRLPASAATNTYLYTKFVAEEMRGLAREHNLVCISGTQTNREGSKAGESTDMGDTADSYGLPMTVDALIALIQNEELFKMKKYLLKVLKTRFGENVNEIYTIGVDRSYMRLLDLPKEEQELPIHVKDMLKYQAEKLKEKKNQEAMEDISLDFTDDE